MRLKIPLESSVKFNSYVTALILVLLLISITNLIDGIGIIASILYLLLVCIPTFLSWKENGTKMFFILFVKGFSSYFFLQLLEREEKNAHIKFGFYLFKHEFFYKTIFLKDNFLVSSSMGQASHREKKDLNEWLTFILYDHNDLVKAEKEKMLKYPGKDICEVGCSGTREKVIIFQKELVDYLNTSTFYSVEHLIDDKEWT